MRRSIDSIKFYIFLLAAVLSLYGPLNSQAFFSIPVSQPPTSTGSPTSSTGSGDKYVSTQDTYVDQQKANNSFGTNSTLQLKAKSLQTKQGLVKFDLSQIPQNTTISKATLSIYVAQKSSSKNTVAVYAAEGQWSKMTTWSKKPPIATTSERSVSVSKAGKYYVLDITGLVQDWVSGTEENNGIYLVASSGEVYINSGDNKKNKPVLNVEKKGGGSTPAPTPTPTPVPTPYRLRDLRKPPRRHPHPHPLVRLPQPQLLLPYRVPILRA